MEDDEQINTLDVLHSMFESDRQFYQTLRFLTSHRESLLAAHQRSNAMVMSILRMQSMQRNRTVQYTATIPLTFPVGWDDPVVVRPSAAQLATATETVTVPEAASNNCAICQDALAPSHTRLTHCGHSFHTDCISEWFTQSVHCPICRHDVRTAGPPAPTASAPGYTTPPVSNRLAAWLVGANPMNHTAETAGSDEHHV